MNTQVVAGTVVLLVIVAAYFSGIETVDEHEQRVLTVFGEYRTVLAPGTTFVPPFVSETYSYDTRTQTIEVPPQEPVTRDNVRLTASATVEITIVDPAKTFQQIGTETEAKQSIANVAGTALRAVIGDMERDGALDRHREISIRTRNEMDNALEEWGIRVDSVEIREVTPPRDSQWTIEW